jgi:hypothetical protein
VVAPMRLIFTQRPSAPAFACLQPATVTAHDLVVGLTTVTGQQPQGWTLSGHGYATRSISEIHNYIGTSAKGAGTAPATADLRVMVTKARGVPPRGRPV